MGPGPLFPSDAIYTSCYCEENIYLLAQSLLARPQVTQSWEIYVTFISNETKTVALWRQKAGPAADLPVVWDYHVILVLRPRVELSPAGIQSLAASDSGLNGQDKPETLVFDFDTTLEVPAFYHSYLKETFPYISDLWALNPVYHSTFRIVPAIEFIDCFASDRSHMIVSVPCGDGEGPLEISYAMPPPPYEPIKGRLALEKGVTHNLMTEFVDMRSTNVGVVVDIQKFAAWCTQSA